MEPVISIRGARVHNLKNISVDIPRNKLVVITGLSGSGKSSLAFDTIYAEGQRRYVESLSAYARQFLGLMDKPDVDRIDGLSPAISIDQKTTSHNPRSTVGTVTEIYDYLRLLYARVGIAHCPNDGTPVIKQTLNQIVTKITNFPADTNFLIIAPIIRDKKGEHKSVIAEARKAGYVRVRLDNHMMSIEEAEDVELDKKKKHNIDIVVDRLTITPELDKERLVESLETALELANGLAVVHNTTKEEDQLFSEHYACAKCQFSIEELEPRGFSFNSPHGACSTCTGLGTKLEVDCDLVIPNKRLSIAEGAIRPWSRTSSNQSWMMRILEAVAQQHGFSLNEPMQNLSPKALHTVLYGTPGEHYDINSPFAHGKIKAFLADYEGVIPNLERRYKETESDYMRAEIERYMRISPCPSCSGKRLNPVALGVTIQTKNIAEVTALSIRELQTYFAGLKLTARELTIAKIILKEIQERILFLHNVGLDYLTLNRAAMSLSGGEAQRIRLATQIGSALTGVIYILDEPSIGLHQRDNAKLIETLKALRDLGNTVIVVEHDADTISAADYIIDIGPGAGKHGGEVVAASIPKDLPKAKRSLTARFMSGQDSIPLPKKYRAGTGKYLEIIDADEFNLKNVSVKIPLGKLVCVTGVSGSGKSTLIIDILAKALSQHFYNAKDYPGKHKEIKGLEHLDKVIHIDQSPIGRTPRSNPATYTNVFTYIRDIFTQVPEAKMRGYKAGRFSFNVKGGRCEACQGDGVQRIEMQLLPDVYVQCEECHGQRYNKQALEIHYKSKTIADVLAMTVEEALTFFVHIPAIAEKLQTLFDVGLGYIQLGQNATTLSGGEAQRVKLATELSRRATGKTLYILDEPTTGLHFADVKQLLLVLNKLVDKGNSVLIIEHNLDVVKSADWLIDLGPDGGDQGGEILAIGTPPDIIKELRSYTGQFLQPLFKK